MTETRTRISIDTVEDVMANIQNNPWYPFVEKNKGGEKGNETLELVCSRPLATLLYGILTAASLIGLIAAILSDISITWVIIITGFVIGMFVTACKKSVIHVISFKRTVNRLKEYDSDSDITYDRIFLCWRWTKRVKRYNVYIKLRHLQVLTGNSIWYYLSINGLGINEIVFTYKTMDGELMRLFGKHIAKKANLNYLDMGDISFNHVILHSKNYAKQK